MPHKKTKSGFTLIEMIVAIGLMGALSALTTDGLINITRTAMNIKMTQSVVNDARAMLNLLTAEIQNNAIDYQEYFNRNACAYNVGFGVDCPAGFPQYGENFKNPAGIPAKNSVCNPEQQSCETYQSYLFLRSPDGMKKTIYAVKKTDKLHDSIPPKSEQTLAVLNLQGCDEDKNGISEKFVMENYSCSDESDMAKPPGDIDLEPGDPYAAKFSPRGLRRTDIIGLKFYVNPSNDPHKAYNDSDSVYQPSVRIVLSVKPSASEYGAKADKANPIIIQTTISQKYLGGIKN